MSLSVVLPSIAFGFNVDIRLHPRHAPTLDDLAQQGFMTDDALKLLRSLLASKYGFVIAGETETGKTTLLNALAQELPQQRPDRSQSSGRANCACRRGSSA